MTLYEALTGQNPFRAATTSETLDRQRALAAPPPADVPPLVAAILTRLLEKDPGGRYRGARELLHALADAAPDVALASGGVPMRPGCGRFFGRDAELAALAARLPPASGGVVGVTGASASGRTRLLDELAARARLLGISRSTFYRRLGALGIAPDDDSRM